MPRLPRSFLAAALAAGALIASLTSACGGTQEGCLSGSCTGGAGGAAGSGGAGGAGAAASCAPTPQSGDYPCDVFAVIHQSCHGCHTDPPANGAPFPLLTYADTQADYLPGKLVFQQMYDQIQPTGAPRMPLGGMLSDADFNTLSNWLASCAPPAPAGTGCGCPGQGCN